MNDCIARALSSVSCGPDVTFENLTMVPLVGEAGRRRANFDYVLLDDALARGDVEITEVSEQGSVPDLHVVNTGAQPVRSVAIDALDSGDAEQRTPLGRDLALQFLAAVSSAPAHGSKAVGIGEDLRVAAPGLTGAALAAQGGVVHLSAFAL